MLILAAANAARNAPGLIPLALLAGAMVVGVVLVYRVMRDMRTAEDETLTPPADLLGPIEEAYASGQMNEEEYQRVRDSALRTGLADTRWTIPVRPVGESGGKPADPATEPSSSEDPARDSDAEKS